MQHFVQKKGSKVTCKFLTRHINRTEESQK